MYLIDTSVLIDFLSGRSTPGTLILEQIIAGDLPFALPAIAVQEVLQGIRSEQDFAQTKAYLLSQNIVAPLDPILSHVEAASLYRQAKAKGLTIRSSLDCLIAQCALERDLILLHNDRDFSALAQIAPLKTAG